MIACCCRAVSDVGPPPTNAVADDVSPASPEIRVPWASPGVPDPPSLFGTLLACLRDAICRWTTVLLLCSV